MKADINKALLFLLGAVGVFTATMATAIQTGAVPLPKEYGWLGVVLVPVLLYVAGNMPKPGTEDILDLSAKIGREEAATVLRAYLHRKMQATEVESSALRSYEREIANLEREVRPALPTPATVATMTPAASRRGARTSTRRRVQALNQDTETTERTTL